MVWNIGFVIILRGKKVSRMSLLLSYIRNDQSPLCEVMLAGTADTKEDAMNCGGRSSSAQGQFEHESWGTWHKCPFPCTSGQSKNTRLWTVSCRLWKIQRWEVSLGLLEQLDRGDRHQRLSEEAAVIQLVNTTDESLVTSEFF